MKNKLALLALGLLLVLSSLNFASADILDPSMKYVPYCAKFTNLNDYPNYTFLILNYGPMGQGMSVIENDVCLTTGYKFSANKVYAIEKSKFDEKKYIQDINTKENSLKIINDSDYKDLIYLNISIGKSPYVPKSSPLTEITDTLTISGENGALLASKSIDRDYSFGKLILAFVLTFVVELFIVWAFVKGKFWKAVLFVFLINLITWPIASFIMGVYGGSGLFLIVEFGVFIVESILIMLFFKMNYWRALLASLAANLATAVIGFFFLFF